MGQTDRRIIFWFDNKTLKKYLSKYPIDQRNEIAKNLFADFINGNYTKPETNENTKQNLTLTTKEKREKTNLALDNLKLWDKIKERGGTPDDFNRLVNHNEIPCFDNSRAETIADEKPKLSFTTFGNTVKYTSKKIKQEDNTLRCLRCNRLIPIFEHGYDQVDTFVKHVNDTHGELTSTERSQLMVLYEK